jgi:LmbE family N-acetylglucosaminyl deacetylase
MRNRILIFAPHPDDELIGCGGVIAQAVQDGDPVHVIEITSGQGLFQVVAKIEREPSPDEVGRLREAETIRACAVLGLDAKHIQFLRFDDGRISSGDRRVESHLPAAEAACLRAIADFKPTRIYCTSAWDSHPDHRATLRAVCAARQQTGCLAPVWQYSRREVLEGSGRKVEVVEIGRWYALKQKAFEAFVCHIGIVSPHQTKPIMANFIEHYCRPQECFIVDPS